MRIATRLTALVGVIAVTGCFSLGRTEPPQRHYLLGGERLSENAMGSSDPSGLTVGVRRLRIAPHLDVPFLVVREESNRISYTEFHRWGEPLGGGIGRVVANQLVSQPHFRAVAVAPWPAREVYDFLIQLHVERFEGVASQSGTTGEGEVHLLATWEILRQRDGAVLARGTTDHRERGWRVGDHGGLVRLLDSSLDVLASDLTSRLLSLESPMAERR